MRTWPAGPRNVRGDDGTITPSSRPASATASAVGAALGVCGTGLILSGAVDLAVGGGDAATLVLIGAGAGAGGAALLRTVVMPTRVPPRIALRTVIVTALVMIVLSAITYLATGTIGRVDDALFESTAGFSTTALTVIPDLESVGEGVLFWRALTQWFGGFFALATIVSVLPFLGVGGPQTTGASAPVGAKHLFSLHVRRLMTRYFGLYLGLTAIGAVLFLIGGMGPFDAASYAFTTISTGGFANHDASFSHFDSATLEWLGVVGMFIGGLSFPLAWSVLRDRSVAGIRSIELQAYVGLILVTTAVLSLTTNSHTGVHDTIRTSAFSATSAVSTTGHWVTDWTGWDAGPQMLLLTLVGIGAMSASMGGGFRIIRALALVSFVHRELLRQLVPRSVRVVRVGRTIVNEETTGRMIGYQVLFIGTVAAGFFALTLTGSDLLTALSGSVSAVATFGPGLGDFAPGTPLTSADHWTLLVLMVLMLTGRIELYPVLNAVVSVLSRPLQLVSHGWQSLRRKVGASSASSGGVRR